jgi:predicted GTPase
LYITLVDPHRPGHQLNCHPGETNLRLADVIVLNKMATASPEGINTVRTSIAKANPEAVVIEGASPIFIENGEMVKAWKELYSKQR